MKKYKCKHCKDKEYVQITTNVRGIKECPYCSRIVLKGYQPFITSELENPPKGSNAKDA